MTNVLAFIGRNTYGLYCYFAAYCGGGGQMLAERRRGPSTPEFNESSFSKAELLDLGPRKSAELGSAGDQLLEEFQAMKVQRSSRT
jgi:hypothetical protein